MAGVINTQPEFLLLGALTVCLMGPECTFEVRPRHNEPCNIFSVCLCEPGTGKTQAYKVAVENPLRCLPSKILIHDYTPKGLFEHLKGRDSHALICHAERTSFYESLMKRQSEGNSERQMFCRFHDGGDSSFIRTSHGRASRGQSAQKPQDEREELQSTCVAVGGFCQPQPYVNPHQALGISDDGFLDRICTCIVASNILKESEVDRWNETLDSFNISEFDDVYRVIYGIHKQGLCKYRFSEEGRHLYEKFSDEVVTEMKRQLQEDIIVKITCGIKSCVMKDLCAPMCSDNMTSHRHFLNVQ